jgi:hypothetical protein
MTRVKPIQCKLAALCAVLAIAITQSAVAVTRTQSPDDNPFKNVNLRSEAQTVDSYCDDLEKLDKDLVVARRKTSLSHEEFNKLRDRALDLKRRWSQLQQAVRSVIAKLKAAGRWDDFDSLILARIRDARIRSSIQGSGGLKRILEGAQSVSVDNDPFFDIEKALRSKVLTRVQDLRFERGPLVSEFSVVSVAYNLAAPRFGDGILCLGAKIRQGISSATNDGTSSSKANCMFICRCISPDMGCAGCDGL